MQDNDDMMVLTDQDLEAALTLLHVWRHTAQPQSVRSHERARAVRQQLERVGLAHETDANLCAAYKEAVQNK